MKRAITFTCLLSISIGLLAAADQASKSSDHSQPAKPAPCLIVKRMGPADKVVHHIAGFGTRTKNFQYIEGRDLPKTYKFHSNLTDHDFREAQQMGIHVIVLEKDYSQADLRGTGRLCRTEIKSRANVNPTEQPTPRAYRSSSVRQARTRASAGFSYYEGSSQTFSEAWYRRWQASLLAN